MNLLASNSWFYRVFLLFSNKKYFLFVKVRYILNRFFVKLSWSWILSATTKIFSLILKFSLIFFCFLPYFFLLYLFNLSLTSFFLSIQWILKILLNLSFEMDFVAISSGFSRFFFFFFFFFFLINYIKMLLFVDFVFLTAWDKHIPLKNKGQPPVKHS